MLITMPAENICAKIRPRLFNRMLRKQQKSVYGALLQDKSNVFRIYSSRPANVADM